MTAPSIEYGVLSPMLIVFGVAVWEFWWRLSCRDASAI